MTDNEPKDLFWHRVKLLSLIAVFLLPSIASWLAFYVFDIRPGSKNYGNLVQPPQPIEFPPLVSVQGQSLDRSWWDKWTFVLVDANGCQQLCQDNLYYLRQMRIALGRDQDRVQNLAVLTQPLGAEMKEFFKEYPLMTVLTGENARLLSQLAQSGVQPGQEPSLYLIDPAGNLMMTYPAEHDSSSILSDMRRLLKVSQIG